VRTIPTLVLLSALAAPLAAQERPVPSDSTRVTLTGCARRSLFVVRWRDDHESSPAEIAEGRRFRLTGRKEVLNDLKAREGSMVELTGLVRKNAVLPPPGISIGGRVRVGIGSPQQPISDPARNPEMYQPVFDVESFQPLPDACPAR
jgi:hypothetical protein